MSSLGPGYCHDKAFPPLSALRPTINPIQDIGEYSITDSDPEGITEIYNRPLIESYSPTPSDLNTVNFSGEYNFNMEIKSTEPKTSWEYSPDLNKLYMKMTKKIPIYFHMRKIEDVTRFKIRAVLVFDQQDDRYDPVLRCPLHRDPSNSVNVQHGHPYVDHIITTDKRGTIYHKDEHSGRCSIEVPIDEIQPGTNYIPIRFSFMCKSSCEGGINRRDISVIFTLEENKLIVGRSSVKVRICSCPKRDMGHDIKEKDPPQTQKCGRGKKRKLPYKPELEHNTISAINYYSNLPQDLPTVPKFDDMVYIEGYTKEQAIEVIKRIKQALIEKYLPIISEYDKLIEKIENDE